MGGIKDLNFKVEEGSSVGLAFPVEWLNDDTTPPNSCSYTLMDEYQVVQNSLENITITDLDPIVIFFSGDDLSFNNTASPIRRLILMGTYSSEIYGVAVTDAPFVKAFQFEIARVTTV